MSKIIIIFISSLIFYQVQQIYGQENDLRKRIKWQPKRAFLDPEKIEGQSKKQYLLSFEEAIYEIGTNYLPYYCENIPVNNNSSAIIENQVFEQINADEIKDVSGLDAISDKIETVSKINFIKKNQVLSLKFLPLRKNGITGNYERLISFTIRLLAIGNKSSGISSKIANTNQSILASGKWLKIKISKSGVYKLSYEELVAAGISNPENVRIFGNGGKMLSYNNLDARPDDLKEINILKSGNTVYFYGVGPVQWQYNKNTGLFEHKINQYSDFAYYFLSSNSNSSGNNIIKSENQSAKPVTHNINTFNDFAYHEIDSVNLIHSGKLWVAEHFDFKTEYNFTFVLPNMVPGSLISAETSLLARSPVTSSFTILIEENNFTTTFNRVDYDYTSTFAIQKIDKFVSYVADQNEVNLKLTYNKGTASSEGWLDYLAVNVQRQLVYTVPQMQFRNSVYTAQGNVGQFSISNTSSSTKIWDISRPESPILIIPTQAENITTFSADIDTLREFIAFEENTALSPILSGDDLGLIQNQNLHGIQSTDMVIVSHPEFIEYSNALKEIHTSNDNLDIQVVSTTQIYNEFSSGAPDVSAIRDFMKMLYDRANTESELPKYLCLFGDGSYDNKHNSGENTNFILSYQSDNSLSPTQSFVTDDFFGLLDDNEGSHNGLLDIGIGRIPVKSKSEASDAIQKIRNYLNAGSLGDWRNRLCFLADDEDNNLHQSQSDELSEVVKNYYPDFNIEKIYIDAFEQESSSVGQRYPDVNLSIDNLISKGLLIMNYTGHGNENGLAEERIIVVDQIKKWNNISKLPIFMTATCEFSRFDNYRKVSAGEHIFLNPNGGAISLFTTTRLVYASPNFVLNKNFYRYIFENNPNSNKRYALGDVMMLTKNSTGNTINSRNFTLLGDPAILLSYAGLYVKTNSINNKPVSSTADTIRAFEKVTVSGEIQTINGEKINTYNGTVYPVVFDKSNEVKTLNNDGEGVFEYKVRNSQIFKGKASVKDGNFQFSFIVPKDIRYNVDTGKISYYGSNNKIAEDSKGQFNNIFIGGQASNSAIDNEGPTIRLYLNDENFVSGGISNQNPKLVAYLSDESGINTTGTGIGHDIMATIDKKSNLQFKLNDYYESDEDDFTNGQIRYSFPELEQGEHQLHFKAWDVYNNSREDSLLFVIKNSDKIEISHVLNYPNPFSTNTSFFFEHNRPGEIMEVLIHVYTVSGKIVKTIHEEIVTQGFRSEGIPWDGRDDFGNKIGRGVYFYRIAIRTGNGEKIEKIEKLLILN